MSYNQYMSNTDNKMWKRIAESIDDYQERMKQSPQFEHFGIKPAFKPGTGDIPGFIHDEIIRQFHNPTVQEDGGKRMDQMINGWNYAIKNSGRQPNLDDIHHIGHLVEPETNHPSQFRHVNVGVGSHSAPHKDDVPHLMSTLASSIPDVKKCDDACGGNNGKTDYYETSGYGHSHPTPLDFYAQYESIHPFGDGNGRSGKIIHNWLNGTLTDPELVPDLFGGGNP